MLKLVKLKSFYEGFTFAASYHLRTCRSVLMVKPVTELTSCISFLLVTAEQEYFCPISLQLQANVGFYD